MSPSDAEQEERLVCAVLAAQVAALRDRIEGGSTVEALWQASDLLGGLAKRVQATSCETTRSVVAGVSDTLDNLAFVQAQRVDLARQMADCVVIALERLARSDGARLQADDLQALYVSEDQRRVHGEAASRFEGTQA